jgi:hypothetical protein
MTSRSLRSLSIGLGLAVALWSASAVVTGLYYVARGKDVNGVMFGALVLGIALCIGSLVVVRRGWRKLRLR